MKKLLRLLFFSSVVFASCTKQDTYQRIADGIIVKPLTPSDSVALVRVQVLSDDIIKISATASDSFSTTSSLMTLPVENFKEYKIAEEEDRIVLSTSTVRVEIIRKTGEVIFKDVEGNVVLKEREGGGRQFVLTEADGQPAYKISQFFESPEDEAFYGLGGHQNGQINYKGEDVELVQHNIVDVVPFLYSNKNYGILWDNYSISHFGDNRPYEPLSSLQLYDRDGNEGGLTASYFVGGKIIRTSVENIIDYEFLETPQVDSFPKDVAQNGKVVWEGTITSNVNGDHKFLVYASGYFKVWIDDKLIMDKWRQNWNPWTNKFNVLIQNGDRHKIKIEWICEGGYMAVKHLDPLPPAEQNRLKLSSEIADEIVYYFIKGDNADDVISGYRQLTGKAPVAPKWALGFWQSRERYRNQEELLNVVKEYRQRKIPLDNIVLDWQYWKDPEWGSHDFDRTRFPDPKEMVETLHEKYNANIMISVWPKFNKGTEHFEEMKRNGFLFMRNIEKARKDWVGVGYESTFYDPFNADAGELFWNQIDRKLNVLHIDAWWLDATEPDMHSNLSLEERKKNMSPTAIGSGAKYFNAYSLMNSKSVYEGQRKSSPEKRVFILTRSAYGGQQRYGAATWSGDIVSRWSDMQDQISTGINFSLSGIPYWTSDIGGFAVEARYYNAKGETLNEWRELNTRWFQFGAFCPLFRSHGQYPFREIYNIAPAGHEAYNTMVYYTKLRYRLMPYIYSLAGRAYFDDYTIMRGLVMDFPQDKNLLNVGDQYMFGPSFLVSPVYEYKATNREVYLPADAAWYDLYSGKHFDGGQNINADAPLSRMPIFVKAGSIIPVGPDIQFTDEKPADPITLYVYAGKNGVFKLYEDEGTNYNYEKGAYSWITFNYDDIEKKLTIGKREGSFDDILQKRTFQIVWITANNPAGMDGEGQPNQVVEYDGTEVSVTMKE